MTSSGELKTERTNNKNTWYNVKITDIDKDKAHVV